MYLCMHVFSNGRSKGLKLELPTLIHKMTLRNPGVVVVYLFILFVFRSRSRVKVTGLENRRVWVTLRPLPVSLFVICIFTFVIHIFCFFHGVDSSIGFIVFLITF